MEAALDVLLFPWNGTEVRRIHRVEAFIGMGNQEGSRRKFSRRSVSSPVLILISQLLDPTLQTEREGIIHKGRCPNPISLSVRVRVSCPCSLSVSVSFVLVMRDSSLVFLAFEL